MENEQDIHAEYYAKEKLKSVNLLLEQDGLSEKFVLNIATQIQTFLEKYQKIEFSSDSNVVPILKQLEILKRQLISLQKLSELNRISTDVRAKTIGNGTQKKRLIFRILDIVQLNFSSSLSKKTILQSLYQDKEKAVEIARSILKEEYPKQFLYNIVYSFTALAELYLGFWRLDDAESLFLETLEILDSIPIDKPFILNPLGWEMSVEEDKRRFLIIVDKVNSLVQLGTIYLFKKQYELSEAKYIEALELLHDFQEEYNPTAYKTGIEAFGIWQIRINHEIGKLYFNQKQYDRAREKYLEAIEIGRRTQTSQLLDTNMPYILQDLAITDVTQHCYEEAENKLREALDRTNKIVNFTGGTPTKVQILNNLAIVLAIRNAPTEGIKYAFQAIEIAEELISNYFYGFSENYYLNYLNYLRESGGDLDCFLTLIWEHFSQVEDKIQAAMDIVLRRKSLTASAIAAKNLAIYSVRYPHLSQQFQELQSLEEKISSLISSSSFSEQKELVRLKQKYEQIQWDFVGQIPEMQLEKDLQTVNREIIAEKLPEKSVLIEFIRFEVRNVESLLSTFSKEVTTARYLAFILPARQPNQVQMVDLGEEAEINQMIQKLRDSASDGNHKTLDMFPPPEEIQKFPDSASDGNNRTLDIFGSQEENTDTEPSPGDTSNNQLINEKGYNIQPAIALSNKLLSPIFSVLKEFEHLSESGKIEHLVFAPDGNLNLLPLGILPVDEQGQTLLNDEYTISYLSVGRDILRSEIQVKRPVSQPLIIADPDFNLSSSQITDELSSQNSPRIESLLGIKDLVGTLEPAAGTGILGKTVAQELGVTVHLGKDALKSNITNTRSPLILLIATHGAYLDQVKEPMMSSTLALAGANTWKRGGNLPREAGNGYIFAQDLARLDLWGTELVILSACNTGVGSITHNGEGVFGLRRAFALAGAKTMVMSLWSVPGKVTALLMSRFLENLQKGLGKTEGLKEAQRYIRTITVRDLLQINLGIEVLEELAQTKGLTQENLNDELNKKPLKG